MFTFPNISSPSLEGAINFTSNEIVTHDWLLLALYTAVPAPERGSLGGSLHPI